ALPFLASVTLSPAEGEAGHIGAAGNFSLTHQSRMSEIQLMASGYCSPRGIARSRGANVAPRDLRPRSTSRNWSKFAKEGCMRRAPIALTMLAVFNILSGALICGVGMLFVGLEDLLNPRWNWETLIVACLPAAGVCYALAGGWMLSQARVDLTRGVIS